MLRWVGGPAGNGGATFTPGYTQAERLAAQHADPLSFGRGSRHPLSPIQSPELFGGGAFPPKVKEEIE